MGVSKTSDHMQIKIKTQNPSQEPPASFNVSNPDLWDMDVLCTFNIKKECLNLEHGCIKDQWPDPQQYQDVKLQSRTSSILQSLKSGLKVHGCFFHRQNQDKEPNFGSWVYQRPLKKSKATSRCQIPVRNLKRPPKPQMRTLGTWMFFAPSKSR